MVDWPVERDHERHTRIRCACRLTKTRIHVDEMRLVSPEPEPYLPETALLPLTAERVTMEAACTFVESIVGAIVERGCRRRNAPTGLLHTCFCTRLSEENLPVSDSPLARSTVI